MSLRGSSGTLSLSRVWFWRDRKPIECRSSRLGTRRSRGWNLASLSRKNFTSPLKMLHQLQGTCTSPPPPQIILRNVVWACKWSFHQGRGEWNRRNRACSISRTLVAVKDRRSESLKSVEVELVRSTHGRAAWTCKVRKDSKRRSVCAAIPFSGCTSSNWCQCGRTGWTFWRTRSARPTLLRRGASPQGQTRAGRGIIGRCNRAALLSLCRWRRPW